MTHSSRRVVPAPPAHPRKDPPAPRCPSRQTHDDFVRWTGRTNLIWVPSGLQASRVMVATSGPGCLSPSAPACTGVHGSRGPRRLMCSTHGSCNYDTCFWELPRRERSTFPRLEFSSTRLCSRQIPDKASSTLGAAQNTDARLPRRRYTSTRSGRPRSRSVDSSEPSRVPRSRLCIETTKVPTIDERSTRS